MKLSRIAVREWTPVLAVWCLVTAINLLKPVHMDDTAHLEIARHILADPLHAMSGKLHWVDSKKPIHKTNQPHLFFYLLAGWMALFGSGNVALHSMMALVSLGAILVFRFLAREVAPGKEIWLIVLLFAGPAFLPSQNLMVDVPLLFLILVFFSGLMLAMRSDNRGWILAAISSAMAILTKYTGLVLLPILVLGAGMLKNWKKLWVLVIPILALVFWSLLNLWDYGGIHILERPSEDKIWFRFLVFLPQSILCLGSVAPICFLVVRGHFRSYRLFLFIAGACISLGILVALYARISSGLWGIAILAGAFFANGLWLLSGTASVALEEMKRQWNPQISILFLWILGFLLFLVAYSPFVAVRHVLLIIPPLLLILGRSFDFTGRSQRAWSTLILSCGLAIILGISDWIYADVYRTQARLLRQQLGEHSRVWYSGHWGWQWYADQQRMLQYETDVSILRAGDFLIQPYLVNKQPLHPLDRDRLRLMKTVTVESCPLTFVRTMSLAPWRGEGEGGGFYLSGLTILPWRLSNDPVEQFDIFQVR